MIEKTIYTYLTNQLDVPVCMGEKPTTKASEYVVLEVIDDGRTNHVDAITFNIESYSTSLQKAAELNALVKTAMFNAISLASVSSSKCGGGGQKIDTQTKTYCYETVFNLYYYS